MEKYIKANNVLRHYKKVVSLQTKYLRPYYTMTKFNSRHTLAAVLLLVATQTWAQIDADNCYFQIVPATVDVNSADYDGSYGYKSTVRLINPADRYVTAYQFDLLVPAGLEVKAITLNKSRYPYSETLGEKTYYHQLAQGRIHDMPDGSTVWRVVCYSIEDPSTRHNRLDNTTADLLDVYCKAASPGVYPLSIRQFPTLDNSTVEVNACDEAGNMEYLKADDTSGVLVVRDGQTQACHTLQMAGDWATLCLPMNVTSVETGGGNEVKFYTVEYDADSGSLLATSAARGGVLLPANTPVLAFAQGGGTFTLRGVPVELQNQPVMGALTGVYQSSTIAQAPDGQGNYVLQKHGGVLAFYRVGQTSVSLQPLRAYVHTSEVSPQYSALQVRISDTETSISDLDSESDMPTTIYSVEGVRVTKTMPNHIYIVNGKKHVTTP